MDDLLSLKGLITVTISSLISIKTLRMNVRVSRDVVVNGVGNVVIVNEALASAQRSFKLLWQVLSIVVALSYPVLGIQYNSILQVLAIVGMPIAFIALCVTVRLYGWHRSWDAFYVAGALVVCWLAYRGNPYLLNTAAAASHIYSTVEMLFAYGLPTAGQWSVWLNTVVSVLMSILSVMGFSALLLSLLYLVFAYLTARSFDDSIRYSMRYAGMAVFGFLTACGGLTALAFHDLAYLGRLVATALPF